MSQYTKTKYSGKLNALWDTRTEKRFDLAQDLALREIRSSRSILGKKRWRLNIAGELLNSRFGDIWLLNELKGSLGQKA